MSFLFLLALLILDQAPGSCSTVTTVGDLSVLEGQSITIPCHYNPQYTSHVKYFCQGRMREFCSSLARTDDPEAASSGKRKVTIADDPTQHVFTVTVRELSEDESGWYWCGVELGGMWVSDSTASLHINVVQGMSVPSNTVTAEERSSISLQCLYSKSLRLSEKRWCRSGHRNPCMVTDSEGRFSGKNIEIRDDRTGMFTVTLHQLQMRDSGWYWCGAGQHQVSVLVSVITRPTTPSFVQSLMTSAVSPAVLSSSDSASFRLWESPLVVCGIVLLLISAFLAIWKLWQLFSRKQKEREANEMNGSLAVSPWREGNYKHSSMIFLNTPAQNVQML